MVLLLLFFNNHFLSSSQLITDQRRGLIDNNPILLEFFHFLFQRNPDFRPTITEILVKFKQMMARLKEEGYLKPKISNTSSSTLKAPPKVCSCSYGGILSNLIIYSPFPFSLFSFSFKNYSKRCPWTRQKINLFKEKTELSRFASTFILEIEVIIIYD